MSLWKYLGVPLTERAPRKSDFQFVLDQVNEKLTAWKAKNLSFAGRMTLAKSVIEAIPIYPMMTAKMPKSCLEEIEKIERDFIWGNTYHVRKVHAVRWEVVARPEDVGGLGLRNLTVMNQACLLKLAWGSYNGNNDLSCKVLKGKYECRHQLDKNVVVKPTSYRLWKELTELWIWIPFNQ